MLTSRQLCTAFADGSLVASRELHNEIMTVGLLGRLLNVGLRNSCRAVSNVASNGVVEKGWFLAYITDLFTKPSNVERLDVLSHVLDYTFRRIIKTLNQTNCRRLSSARGPDKGNSLALFKGEVEPLQHLLVGACRVSESHILELDVSNATRHVRGIGSIQLGEVHLAAMPRAARSGYVIFGPILLVDKLAVVSVLAHKLIVRSVLNNFTRRNYIDLVGVADRRQTVRND